MVLQQLARKTMVYGDLECAYSSRENDGIWYIVLITFVYLAIIATFYYVFLHISCILLFLCLHVIHTKEK